MPLENNSQTSPQLFPYQIEGVELITRKYKDVLLADHPGAGKTCQAVISADVLNCKRIIVVCPAGLRENWRREFGKWSNRERKVFCIYSSKDLDNSQKNILPEEFIVICSYDLAPLMEVRGLMVDLLILDEAHYLKNRKSKRTKACLENLWNHAKKRMAITGTPLPNGRAIEAFSLFSKFMPRMFPTFKSFTSQFCIREETPWGISYNKSRRLKELGEIARANFMIRREHENTLGQLPPLMRINVPLEGEVSEEFRNATDIVNALLALNGGIVGDHLAQIRRFIGLSKVRRAVQYIKILLEENECVVVFAHHKLVIEELSRAFGDNNINYVQVTGETSQYVRQKSVDDFQAGKAKVFLGSLLACNTGITLTRARDVVFVECDWVPENNVQAEGRIYRVSQKHTTRSHYLTLPDSIDDAVTRALIKKQKDILKVLGD